MDTGEVVWRRICWSVKIVFSRAVFTGQATHFSVKNDATLVMIYLIEGKWNGFDFFTSSSLKK